jgi:hypothetical protein
VASGLAAATRDRWISRLHRRRCGSSTRGCNAISPASRRGREADVHVLPKDRHEVDGARYERPARPSRHGHGCDGYVEDLGAAVVVHPPTPGSAPRAPAKYAAGSNTFDAPRRLQLTPMGNGNLLSWAHSSVSLERARDQRIRPVLGRTTTTTASDLPTSTHPTRRRFDPLSRPFPVSPGRIAPPPLPPERRSSGRRAVALRCRRSCSTCTT